MSWNNQGGGPWRSPGQGPWGQGPAGSPPPSDLEELLRRMQEGLRGLAPGGGGFGGGFGMRGVVLLALAALLIWFALGSFYSVQPNEVGINLVFGRYTGKTAAGLNTNWPWPVGSVIKVPVWDQQITEVGYRGDANSADILAESQMLTGDQNIVNVRFRVIWQIDPAHPEYFVFNILYPKETVKAVAESIMREVVGLKTIDGVLTSDRKSIEPDVRDRMQKVLEGYQRRRPDQAGAVAVGRRAGPGDFRLSRRDRGAAGSAARGQRRRHLRQSRRARGGRGGRAHPRRGQGLSRRRRSSKPRARRRVTTRSTRNIRTRRASRASACISRRWSACSPP